MRELIFKGLRVKVESLAGARIVYGSKIFCIDVLNPSGCNVKLYTHTHPRHFPELLEFEADNIISPSLGFKVKPGDTIKIDENIKVEVVEAYNRPALSREIFHPKGLGVGYIVNFGEVRVYHMGDTDLIDDVFEIANRKVDIAFIPIGGASVMTPDEAREAVKSLRPTITVPIHFEDIRYFHIFRDMVQPYTQVLLLRG